MDKIGYRRDSLLHAFSDSVRAAGCWLLAAGCLLRRLYIRSSARSLPAAHHAVRKINTHEAGSRVLTNDISIGALTSPDSCVPTLLTTHTTLTNCEVEV